MLKRLELLGFKSFADKTAFEFGAGITCIVGPNGSGKSNVVDAIKWVLGEQSAKSLRGKEMADVIFNGSATRRSLGFAEATLVFDNSQRVLPVDADVVQLTRRVYRSGEGEYLINKNPSRLRDFRELFMGTGADAYCVIEQGKVDVLLQSSTKDRRAIFEEAAGISRFKARKIETLRKLEHVDQNLIRLSDIVEEVEKQLRSVKLQAAKAKRHQEHSQRLRELRISISLAEYHEISCRLDAIDGRTAGLADSVSEQSNRCNGADAKLLQVQSLVDDVETEIRSLESTHADCRQEIARLESEIGYERAHSRDLAGQIDRLRGQWVEFSSRVADLEQHIVAIRSEVEQVDQRCAIRRAEVDAESAAVDDLRSQVERSQQDAAETQSRLMDLVQSANQLHNQLAAIDSNERTLKAQHQRLQQRCHALAGPLDELRIQIESLTTEQQSATTDRDQIRQALDRIDRELEIHWLSQQEISSSAAALREERSAVAARIELLGDLERRYEGVAGGVQHVLTSAEFAPLRVGIVADLLPVDVAHAAWVERALGEHAQTVVVRSRAELTARLQQLAIPLPGTVRFLALDCLPLAEDYLVPLARIQEMLGYVAHGAELVRPVSGADVLAARLLGNTVVVSDLDAAVQMASRVPGFRFVTSGGDLLELDGSITTGSRDEGVGIVSRKSQLRALEADAASLDVEIAEHDRKLQQIQQDQVRLKQERAGLDARLLAASDQAARLGSLLSQRRQQLAGLSDELDLHHSEIAGIDRELAQLADERNQCQSLTVHNVEERDAAEQTLHDHDSAVERGLAEIDGRHEQLTAGKIELAKTEGQLAGLRQRLTALVADLQDRQRVLAETNQQIDAALQSDQTCQRKILSASASVARLYVVKEQNSRQTAELDSRRNQFRQQRQAFASESQSAREQLQQLQQRLHEQQLEANELKHQRGTLDQRILEDYEVQLTSLYGDYQPDPSFDRSVVQQEIQELRRKITGLGNVNLEALTELQELETRATTLQSQIKDLTESKNTLDEIIRKINQDSERLFVATLESVRTHFGELFKKLFGGGRADILLENEADVLESGIEIVARPPGKELRSLSLLSGGEKTLTTVALLMAVFRAKPSPFCILDEVDAALDEANVERYTTMLREFASQAQFIMITHSKKSMVCADVLYGITMQESGVSKRVSVRFEDVGEQGEISSDALERAEPAETGAAPAPSGQEAA